MNSTAHDASGTASGFVYQFDRALEWLALSPAGCRVGIETGDDVVVVNADGSSTLEQDKHTVREGTTHFGDRSKELWNTLKIWMEAVATQSVSLDSSRFMMVSNRRVPQGIALEISAATTDDQAIACIGRLKEAAINPPDTSAAAMAKVLEPGAEKILHGIILRCEVVQGNDGSASKTLRASTVANLQLPDWCTGYADSIVDELTGWLQGQVQSSWESRQPAWVERNHFVNQLHQVIEARRRLRTRERAANLIPVYDEAIGQEKGSVFVRQVYLVTDDDSAVESCIREYIRCNIEKNRLSEEGNITDQEWLSFEADLHSRWEKIQQRNKRLGKNSPEEEVGFKVFTETTEEHRGILGGLQTEQVYLTAGSYHRMANALHVGWHPRYEELLKAQDTE